MNKKLLKDYLKTFFNNNLFREFRILNENKIKNKRFFLIANDPKKESFLLSQVLLKDKTENNNIYSEIYPFKDYDNLLLNKKQIATKKTKKLHDFSNNKPVRTYDRLYFDFDFDKNKDIAKLKEEINTAILKNDKPAKKEYIQLYHEHLLDNKIAIKPLEELKKLTDYLDNKGIKSYPLFSGSKGFHLYIFFNNSLFNPDSFNTVAGAIFKLFKDTLKLETLDKAVFDNPSQRIARLPYCKHPVTELYCYPIDVNNGYNAIIEESFKPTIKELNINEHLENTGNIELLDWIANNILLENQKQDRLKELKNKRKKLQRTKDLCLAKKYKNTGYKVVEKDCIKIAEEFLGSPEHTYGNYVTYKCFNHNDKKPSLTVYKDRFYCAVCGFNLNYLGFVMKYTGADEKEAMKILLNRC